METRRTARQVGLAVPIDERATRATCQRCTAQRRCRVQLWLNQWCVERTDGQAIVKLHCRVARAQAAHAQQHSVGRQRVDIRHNGRHYHGQGAFKIKETKERSRATQKKQTAHSLKPDNKIFSQFITAFFIFNVCDPICSHVPPVQLPALLRHQCVQTRPDERALFERTRSGHNNHRKLLKSNTYNNVAGQDASLPRSMATQSHTKRLTQKKSLEEEPITRRNDTVPTAINTPLTTTAGSRTAIEFVRATARPNKVVIVGTKERVLKEGCQRKKKKIFFF
jgi:hypothetical protein